MIGWSDLQIINLYIDIKSANYGRAQAAASGKLYIVDLGVSGMPRSAVCTFASLPLAFFGFAEFIFLSES